MNSISVSNFREDKPIKPKRSLPKKEKRTTILMLIKLLATSNVANNFLGFSNNLVIIWIFFRFFCEASSKSFWDKEKNATSAPEIITAKNNSVIIPRKAKIKLASEV